MNGPFDKMNIGLKDLLLTHKKNPPIKMSG